jgi:hypothetical protein
MGTVKWFNATKGYGFIQPDDGGNALALERCVKAKRSATKSSPIAVPANPPPTIYAPRAESGPRWKSGRRELSTAAIFGLVPTRPYTNGALCNKKAARIARPFSWRHSGLLGPVRFTKPVKTPRHARRR